MEVLISKKNRPSLIRDKGGNTDSAQIIKPKANSSLLSQFVGTIS